MSWLACVLPWFGLGVASIDWPQWGGATRSFEAAAPVPLSPWSKEGPKVLWQRELGPGNSGVAVGGDIVVSAFRQGEDEVLAAFDRASGAPRWRWTAPAPLPTWFDAEFGRGPHSTPLNAGDAVVFVGILGQLSVVSRATGALRWKADLGGTPLERGYAASPLVFEDLVIAPAGGPGRALCALRIADGSIAWSSGDEAATYASSMCVEVESGAHVVALGQGTLVGRDPRTGAELWRCGVDCERYALATTPLACPLGRVAFVDRRGLTLLQIRRYEAAQWKVEPIWTSRRIGSQLHNLVLAGDVVIGANESATLCGLALADGAAVFRERALAESNVIRNGSNLVTLSTSGTLALSKLDGGALQVAARHELLSGRVWAAPALADGVLYARDDRRLIALDLRARSEPPSGAR